MAGQLRIGVPAALVITMLGVPVGLLWTVVAPRTAYIVAAGHAFLGDPETQTLIAADGWFATLTAAAGLFCGIIGYLLAGRLGDMGLLTALAAGGTAAAIVAWRVGHLVGLSAFQHLVRTGRAGVTVRAALDLHATGVIIAWPLIAVIAYGLLEALDLAGREPQKRLAAGDLGRGRAGEPDQVGGGQLDLKAAPTCGHVDRREA